MDIFLREEEAEAAPESVDHLLFQEGVRGQGQGGVLIQDLARLRTRDDRRPNAPLFTTKHGSPMDRHSLRRMIIRAALRAGVARANVHRFRHTFAINFLRNGGNVFALKEPLRHESMNTVLRYLDLAQADVKEAHRVASPVANWAL